MSHSTLTSRCLGASSQRKSPCGFDRETAAAFSAQHPTNPRGVAGVAACNVQPNKAGSHFNKVQCFCFEEQRLRAGEEVDMPVFFYLDPELSDPAMRRG